MKRGLLAMALLLLLAPLGGRAEADELRGYVKGQGYQYAYIGQYPYDKDGTVATVLWRVLSVENGQALLMTEYVIDTTQIIFEDDPKIIEAHSYRCISSWEESDAYPYLNTTVLDNLMGNSALKNALIDKPGFGRLFVLTTEEYCVTDYGFSSSRWGTQPSRYAEGTPYALKQRNLYRDHSNGMVSYWTATPQTPQGYKMELVGYNGHISAGAYTRVNVGIRPCILLDLSQVKISGGSGTKAAPYTFAYTGSVPAPEATAAPIPTEQPQITEEPAIPEPADELSEEEPAIPESADVPSEAEPAAEEATPAPERTAGPSVTISFVGDCSVGDSYQYKQSDTGYHTAVDLQGYAWPFSLVSDYLKNDDLTVANLEVVFTTRAKHTEKLYNLCADPDHVNVLLEGGVEMVNTVNNHCWDFDQPGYDDSIAVLDEAGIGRFGTVYPGQSYGHDDLGVADLSDIRVGFVGFSYPQDSDVKRIAARIEKLKGEMGCDLVVVSLHWGRETYMTPEPWQLVYAKDVINAGADVIWGHHPHVIQPIQFYKGKPIFYSTGNFTFGTMGQVDPSTGIFQLTYHKDENGETVLDQLQVIPCQTQPSPDFRPYELTDPDARREVWEKLTFKKEYNNCENPPASFLDTGIVRFENGQMLP